MNATTSTGNDKMRDLIDSIFPTTFEFTARAGKPDAVTYNLQGYVLDKTNDYRVVLERCSLKVGVDDYRGSIQLRVLDAAGGWVSGVMIYGPELDWLGMTDRPAVKDARVSNSSGGQTIANARATAHILQVAANLAESWTDFCRPELEAAAAKREEENKAHRAAVEAKRQQEQLLADEVEEIVKDTTVRVKIKNRASALSGTMKRVPGRLSFEVTVPWRNKPFELDVAGIEKLEIKQNGRYIEIKPLCIKEEI